MRALVAVAVALSACASQSTWTKRAPANWDLDDYECQREARMPGQQLTSSGGARLDHDFYEKCLRVRGWTKAD